jgi:hypothetical protein
VINNIPFSAMFPFLAITQKIKVHFSELSRPELGSTLRQHRTGTNEKEIHTSELNTRVRTEVPEVPEQMSQCYVTASVGHKGRLSAKLN